MTRTRLALSAMLAVASIAAAPALAEDIDKVNGSITAQAGQSYGDLSTVNGSIRIQDGASIDDAQTVNGAIRVADNVQAASLTTVNGSQRLGQSVRIGDDLSTVNGGIFVDRGSDIGGDITTVNGSIGLVDTELAGGITTVNGDITVGIGSHVRGGITVEKPQNNWLPISFGQRRPLRIVIAQNTRVDGPLHFEREVKLYVHASARIGTVTGATAVRYDGARAPDD